MHKKGVEQSTPFFNEASHFAHSHRHQWRRLKRNTQHNERNAQDEGRIVSRHERVAIVGALTRAQVNPRCSAASAVASVLPTEESSSGTHKGSIRRIFLSGFFVSYSTPRAVWASMMAFISCEKIGTKRSAVVNVNA